MTRSRVLHQDLVSFELVAMSEIDLVECFSSLIFMSESFRCRRSLSRFCVVLQTMVEDSGELGQ